MAGSQTQGKKSLALIVLQQRVTAAKLESTPKTSEEPRLTLLPVYRRLRILIRRRFRACLTG
jgi:hypothetical protein